MTTISNIKCQKTVNGLKIDYHCSRDGIPFARERRREWKLTQLFCPGCGAKDMVYVSEDIRKYEAGEQYLCLSCGFGFFHPAGEQYSEVPKLVLGKMMEAVHDEKKGRDYKSKLVTD